MESSAMEARLLLTSRRDALCRGGVGGAEERRELSDIDAALARIEDGSYGSCERCGGAIGRHRLRALPEVRLCATCSAG